jgi:DNA-binding NarL/FixJ family response regulator
LADDHPSFPDMVQSFLEPLFEVIGKVTNGRDLLAAAMNLKPDVIVTDISMPVLNGIDAANQLKELGCTSRIVFLTVHSDSDFIRAGLATGAFAFVVKSQLTTDLILAIREAIAGHIFISPTQPVNQHVAVQLDT